MCLLLRVCCGPLGAVGKREGRQVLARIALGLHLESGHPLPRGRRCAVDGGLLGVAARAPRRQGADWKLPFSSSRYLSADAVPTTSAR